jgi:uncharacterized protein YdhG (YjbR/CyaY superfamily)
MKTKRSAPRSIDEYILGFPPETRKILKKLRAVIKASAPGAEEKISYQMPAFALKGNLVYFAAYENHIGFYPTSSGIDAFRRELSNYKMGKGSVQFPIRERLPFELISRMVKFRVAAQPGINRRRSGRWRRFRPSG